jgi:hypothetical protein
MLVWKVSLGGDMKALFMNTKKLSSVVLNNFKPMIPTISCHMAKWN